MRLLLQRVEKAAVSVDSGRVSEIGPGLLILVGIGRDDRSENAKRLARKVSALRIFEDANGKMNLNISQVGGRVLSVPQFTLYADLKRGNRPGFEMSAPPQAAAGLWRDFDAALRDLGIRVEEGVFGAHMKVDLVNDGPVTIWLNDE